MPVSSTASKRRLHKPASSAAFPPQPSTTFGNISKKGIHPPGCFDDDPRIIRPVIVRTFSSDEPDEWILQHELEIGLRLQRKGDVWVCPREGDLDVMKLVRRPDGEPGELLIRAEHLRDYLCARRSALLVASFYLRQAIEERVEDVPWQEGGRDDEIACGTRELRCMEIHEGGLPYGEEISVVHTWRESVDPDRDVPVMPPVANDKSVKGRSYSVKDRGRKLQLLSMRAWLKHWIEPGVSSPRVRGDEVEVDVPFIVDNQAQGKLSGSALKEHSGWLWFRPAVMHRLLGGPKGHLRWYTRYTGRVGPGADWTLHFGVNSKGLINVLAHDMADQPEWVQKIWAADSIMPEGGLSRELSMAQNLAQPALTSAPEEGLWRNLNLLQADTERLFGKGLFLKLAPEREFYRQVHRFYCDCFEDYCRLCKELHRVVTEQIDLGALNAVFDPKNAKEANEKKLRQIKRVELWLERLGKDGRTAMQPLAAVSDLRQGDAHKTGSELRESLELLHIPKDSTDYEQSGLATIEAVAWSLAQIGRTVNSKARGRDLPKASERTLTEYIGSRPNELGQ